MVGDLCVEFEWREVGLQRVEVLLGFLDLGGSSSSETRSTVSVGAGGSVGSAG